MRTTHTIATEFEDRICVFLDILGFQDHLDQAVGDPNHIRRISAAFARLNANLRPGGPGFPSRRISQYSDCVTVSYDVTETSSAWDMLTDLQYLLIDLAGHGFLVRGGVTVGPLVHDENQLFGPAQVNAWQLESKHAIYPRVVVDESVINHARQHHALQNSADEEEEYLRGIVSKDFDGRLFIGYITKDSVVHVAGADPEDYPSYIQQIVTIVENGLTNADPRILAKMLWLYGKLLDAREADWDDLSDVDFPDALRSAAQGAYRAIAAHLEEKPLDAGKCALPLALITDLTSN